MRKVEILLWTKLKEQHVWLVFMLICLFYCISNNSRSDLRRSIGNALFTDANARSDVI